MIVSATRALHHILKGPLIASSMQEIDSANRLTRTATQTNHTQVRAAGLVKGTAQRSNDDISHVITGVTVA